MIRTGVSYLLFAILMFVSVAVYFIMKKALPLFSNKINLKEIDYLYDYE